MLEAHAKRYKSGMLEMGRSDKVVIPMVGLPARGKSYFSKKITRYLHWLGYSCKIFNIGNYRRKFVGTTNCKANFFDNKNTEAVKQRQEAAQAAVDDLIQFLLNGGDVAIFDGTNTTKERRQFIVNEINKKIPNAFIMFSELICDDDSIINKNIRLTKINSPDYENIDPEEAQKDFLARIQKYQEVYETIDDEEGYSYIKLFNLGKKFTINGINGYLPCKILSFIFHYHVQQRPIYLARAGKVEKLCDVLGGDWKLGESGQQFGENLNKFFQEEFGDEQNRKNIKILTSTKVSALQTAKYIDIGIKCIQMKCLDELNFGKVDGMELQEIEDKFPEIYQQHMKKDISYRYPKGESFLDLIQRLEPIIFEIERSKSPVVVISHHYMLKALYCYFVSKKVEDVMDTIIPKHSVVKLIPDVNDCEQFLFELDQKANVRKSKILDLNEQIQIAKQHFTQIQDQSQQNQKEEETKQNNNE